MTQPTLHQFIRELEASKTHYFLHSAPDGAVIVMVTLPSERWEVEFFEDREPQVEIFRSDGKIFALESVPVAEGNEEI